MEENKSSVGGILGTIIIIALIVLGGLYFWGKRIEESKNVQKLTTDNMPTVEQNATSEAAVIKSMSASDDVDSIDTDLKNTKLDNLSQELDVQVQ
jgi:FtsZ-interacting cell division protein ZipA